MVFKSSYPNKLKVSQINPNLEMDKNLNLIDSYGPLTNFSCIDILMEEL